MKTLIVLICFVLLILSIVTAKVYKSLTMKELRRRARSGHDANAVAVYKMAAYGKSLDIFLWAVAAVGAAILLLSIAEANKGAAVFGILAVSALVLTEVKFPDTRHVAWKIVAVLAPIVANILGFIRPVIVRFPDRLKNWRRVRIHTGVYEKEDLIDLIKVQIEQPDNRIPEEELDIVSGALTFGDKTVGSVMTPRRIVKFVAANDSVGPLLMDELHASGFSRFPVIKESSSNEANLKIIGTLYLRDLVGYDGKGKVSDVMKPEVCFINEAQTLRDALAGLLKMQHHLAVVVNDFEEVSGVISLEDIVEQILGQKIVDEFDQYDDLRAVAARQAQKDHSQRALSEVK